MAHFYNQSVEEQTDLLVYQTYVAITGPVQVTFIAENKIIATYCTVIQYTNLESRLNCFKVDINCWWVILFISPFCEEMLL